MKPRQNLHLTELALARAKEGDYQALAVVIEYEQAFEQLDRAEFRTERELALISIEECERKLERMIAG